MVKYMFSQRGFRVRSAKDKIDKKEIINLPFTHNKLQINRKKTLTDE